MPLIVASREPHNGQHPTTPSLQDPIHPSAPRSPGVGAKTRSAPRRAPDAGDGGAVIGAGVSGLGAVKPGVRLHNKREG